MCDVCMQTPCDYRCPNAALAQPVLLCECCGGEIYEGEIYYECVDGMEYREKAPAWNAKRPARFTRPILKRGRSLRTTTGSACITWLLRTWSAGILR